MKLKPKIKGITGRWVVNVMTTIAICVIVIIILFCLFITRFYYSNFVDSVASYQKQFDSLSSVGFDQFDETARKMCAEFEHKDKVEIEIIDYNDEIVVNTTGFQSEKQKSKMLKNAEKSADRVYITEKKSDSDERLLFRTAVLYSSDGKVMGAVRASVSMEGYYQYVNTIILLAIIIGLIIIALSMITGIFFIRSIVMPLRNVSNVAGKIALGDFSQKIDVRENDEIGELCDAINYMASELQSTENVKNEFLSSISHELRTPLTAIKGWSETAKMSVGFDNDTVERGLEIIENETDRLSGLVEELLDFSRMQSGRLNVVKDECDIIPLLNDCVFMYKEVATQHGITLEYNRPANDFSPVLADKGRMKQVFINIIDNAVKYSTENGKIIVTPVEEEACIKITVRDTGCGIPAADLSHVKEKFYKSNTKVRGSGIGLAVADEIVKLHGGLLLIESTEGVGTSATIVIPTKQVVEKSEEIYEGEKNE